MAHIRIRSINRFPQSQDFVLDGVETVFNVAFPFIESSVSVYLNGQKLTIGVGNDYVLSGENEVTLTLPYTSDFVLSVTYFRKI